MNGISIFLLIYDWYSLDTKNIDIDEGKYVSPDLFDVLVGKMRKGDLTSLREKIGIEDIIRERESVLNQDFDKTGANYIYKSYIVETGSMILGDAVFFNNRIEYYSEGYLSESSPVSSLNNREYLDNGSEKSGLRVIDRDNKKRDAFLKVIYREVEDRYRIKKGMPEVGQGWISESFLFKQIEAAFPDIEVQQHASPVFLGRQHYDVYLPKYKIALEYQGEQHFNSVEYFGGEEALAENKKRDDRKRKLSEENGVYLIEVLPGYEIEDLIRKIISCIDKSADEGLVKAALEQSAKIKRDISTEGKIKERKGVSKKLEKVDLKAEQKEALNSILDDIINKLVSEREMSPNADKDWALNVSKEDFERGYQIYLEAEQLKGIDPEEALKMCMELIKGTIYKAPVVFGCAAQILRKQKRFEEELDLLLQMKKDYGYTNYDSRIRNMIKPQYIGGILREHPELTQTTDIQRK